jgi:hypothetical protein
MIAQFYTWNEIKQMMLLWIIGKSDKLANRARNKYLELAHEDEQKITLLTLHYKNGNTAAAIEAQKSNEKKLQQGN